MSFQKRTADLLFAVQLIGAILFCGAQFLRSLEDVHGVSVIQFTAACAFVVFNLFLGIGAHRAQPSRVTRQAIASYVVWGVLLAVVVAAVCTNNDYRWSIQDTTILVLTGILAAATLMFGRFHRLPIRDPMLLAFLAIACKSVPQLLLVWTILDQGGSGIPGLSIIVGHCTIFLRLGQVSYMIWETGWERNRKWLFVSEGAAEVTWIAATIAWLVML